MRRYVFGVFAIVIVAVLIIFLIAGRPSGTKLTKAKVTLVDYAAKNSQVSQMTQGPIVGEDQFRSIRITVTRENRTLEILQGYEFNVISSSSFTNTQPAYETFLSALNTAGFAKTRPSNYPDERGVCPLNNRYLYDLNADGVSVIHSWSTNCSIAGSFAGNAFLTRQIFQNQIPDYFKLTTGVQL